MFKKITSHQGFWKAVLTLTVSFMVLFLVVKWIIEGFSFDFVNRPNPLIFFGGLILAGFVYGFLWNYGKFYKKIKEQERG